MIQLIPAAEIGYSECFGRKLHEEIESMTTAYEDRFKQKVENNHAVVVLMGSFFYVIFSKYPNPNVYGRVDSAEFVDFLDFVIENAQKQG
jgi:hypothetical protein